MSRRSCVVELFGTQAEGEVHLVDGNIVHAVFGEMLGEEAVFAALSDPEVRSGIRPAALPTEQRSVFASAHHLLLEGARRSDEGSVRQPMRRSQNATSMLPPPTKPKAAGRLPAMLIGAAALLAVGGLAFVATNNSPWRSLSPFKTLAAPSPSQSGQVAAPVDANSLQAGDTKPVLIDAVPPKRPNNSVAVTPTIIVRVLVGTTGTVEQAQIYRSRLDLSDFEEAALDAVRHYRFQAANHGGKLIPVWVNLPVSFANASTAQKSLRIKGSDTIGAKLGPALARAFKELNGAEVNVEGLGSATAFGGLFDGSADIGASSRPVNPEELRTAKSLGIELQEFVLGFDGIAVIVHPSNPLKQATVAELAPLFTGETPTWAGRVPGFSDPVHVVTRPTYSGTHSFFKERVLRLGDRNSKAEFAASASVLEHAGECVKKVASDPMALGYAGLGNLTSAVKVLPLQPAPGKEAVLPSPTTIREGRYPVYRPLLLYTRGRPTGVAARFIAFALSDAGRALVTKDGFIANDAATFIALDDAGEQGGGHQPQLHRIEFPVASTQIDHKSREVLQQVVLALQNKSLRAIVVGHADSEGSEPSRLRIASLRGEIVANSLRLAGIEPARVTLQAEGDSLPVATNETAVGRTQNRRVDIYVVERR